MTRIKYIARVSLVAAFAFWCEIATTVAADGSRFGYEAFLEPYRTVEVAASESGRVARVFAKRGTAVQPGDVLLELDTSVLEAAHRIALKQATSTLKVEMLQVELQQKQRRFDTLQKLRRDGAGTEDELLAADSEVQIATLRVATALEESERYQLEAEEIQARIEQRRVRVHMSGIVTDVYRDVDEFVSSVEPVVAQVVELDRLRATFHVLAEDAERLRVDATVMLNILKDGRLLDGRVEHVGPVTQSDSGRVRVDVVVQNSKLSIRSGQRCALTLKVGQSVSADAVRSTLSITPTLAR